MAATTATLKFPLGIDNRSREYELPDGAARDLVNVDVTRAGGLRVRDGIRQVALGAFHSLFAHPAGHSLLLVLDGVLRRMDAEETFSPLANVAGSVVYAELNGEVFWSDGSSVGRVRADGTAAPWGLTPPGVPPLTVMAGGSLPPGRYQVAMTAIHLDTGLESGATEPAGVELTTAGLIQITAPTASADFGFRFYLTPPNGESSELRGAATVDPGSTVTLATSTPDGPRLQSLLAVKPYPSTRLCAYKGRLWGAIGTTVWYTSERSPHWLFPATGFFSFESPVLMLGAAEDGLYVGLADRTYYLQGNHPGDMTQRLVSTVGATAGGGESLPPDVFAGQGSFPSRQCAWWDTEGVWCVGKPGGVIVRPHGDRYSAGTAQANASAYHARYGIRRWVSVLTALQPLEGSLQAVDVPLHSNFVIVDE